MVSNDSEVVSGGGHIRAGPCDGSCGGSCDGEVTSAESHWGVKCWLGVLAWVDSESVLSLMAEWLI